MARSAVVVSIVVRAHTQNDERLKHYPDKKLDGEFDLSFFVKLVRVFIFLGRHESSVREVHPELP